VVLLAADHGQVDVDPATTVYVTRRGHELRRFWPVGGGDAWLAPPARRATSSCTAAETVDEVIDGLARLLGERATVHSSPIRRRRVVRHGSRRVCARGWPTSASCPAGRDRRMARAPPASTCASAGHHGSTVGGRGADQVAALVV